MKLLTFVVVGLCFVVQGCVPADEQVEETEETMEVVDASIDPEAAEYELDEPADVETVITWNDASAVDSINDLTKGDDYTVTDIDGDTATLTILNDYLAGELQEGGDEVAPTVSFDEGEDAIFTITATEVDELDGSKSSFTHCHNDNEITVTAVDGHGNLVTALSTDVTDWNVELAGKPNDDDEITSVERDKNEYTITVEGIQSANDDNITKLEYLPGNIEITRDSE